MGGRDLLWQGTAKNGHGRRVADPFQRHPDSTIESLQKPGAIESDIAGNWIRSSAICRDLASHGKLFSPTEALLYGRPPRHSNIYYSSLFVAATFRTSLRVEEKVHLNVSGRALGPQRY